MQPNSVIFIQEKPDYGPKYLFREIEKGWKPLTSTFADTTQRAALGLNVLLEFELIL